MSVATLLTLKCGNMGTFNQDADVPFTRAIYTEHPVSSLFSGLNFSNGVRCLSTESSGSKSGKQPRQPYMIFVSEKYSDVQKANPGVKPTVIASMIGQLWRSLPENEKEPYRALYAEEKASAVAWKASLSDEEKKKLLNEAREKRDQKLKRRHRKLNKQLERPIPSDVNPFLLYLRASTVERGDAPLAQFVKGLSEHWKIMPVDDKEEYIQTAKANSIVHRQKVADWKKRMIAQGHAEALGLKPLTKSRTRAQKKVGKTHSDETDE